MKKAKYIILLSLTILLTGCVKSNTTMTINKDKNTFFTMFNTLKVSAIETVSLCSVDKDDIMLGKTRFINT